MQPGDWLLRSEYLYTDFNLTKSSVLWRPVRLHAARCVTVQMHCCVEVFTIVWLCEYVVYNIVIQKSVVE